MSGSSDEKSTSSARGSASSDKPTQGETADLSPAEMAQAFRDLARGEQQAAALEANLTNLESKLDALLASLDQDGAITDPPRDNAPESKEDKEPEDKKA